MDTFDVVVIGAGSTGEVLAGRAAGHGLSVAVVESELVGGECSYYACIPSKALLRPVHALAEARAVAGSRQAVDGTLAADAVLARRDEFASHWKDDGQLPWLAEHHVELVRGRARLSGVREVTVATSDGENRTLHARRAVAVCAGSTASIPDVPGLRAAKPWTNRQGTSAPAVPESLVVLGGGPVGCELATAWKALGADVTVVLQEERPLAKMETFAGDAVLGGLRALGVWVVTEERISAVARNADGTVDVTLGGGPVLHARELLCAAGREPRTADLGLDRVGLEPGAWLHVDDRMRVQGIDGGWLFAAGDVTHRALLTHMGKYQARVCGDVIAADDPAQVAPAIADSIGVTQVVFTDPEVASAGLTERAARERGLRVDVVDFDLGEISGARLFADNYKGRARIVIDADRRVLVGATFVGKGVGELLHAATIAIVGEVPLDRLWHAVPAFPTMNEIWLRLLETAGL
jgi:pyruvate/2-oxoglutarate dehydrogenase complex dihydrolipoamide dehydrogenase (E3) component